MKTFVKKAAMLLSVTLVFLFTGCYTANDDGASQLSVHFLDVGQADCALLLSGDEAMLIDGGNVNDSSLVYSYLTDWGVEHLDYIIGTHAHEDHMGGLSGALSKATAGKIFIPEIGSDDKFYRKFIEMAQVNNTEIAVPQSNESFVFGDCEVTLITPTENDEEDINNTSIIARVECGEKSFLFTGDCERSEEADILRQGVNISANVLKSPHHGSDSSSSYPFLREVMPEIVVISVGADNSYGHPHEDVLARYEDLGAIVYRTDKNGHIVIKTDGKNLIVEPGKDKKTTPLPKKEDVGEYRYIGNSNSKKLHLPTCANLPKSENRVYFENREKAISTGYTPCKGCNP